MDYVAPRVGAWIETSNPLQLHHLMMSHPVWVRGLKPKVKNHVSRNALSHPVWVRGLKLLTLAMVIPLLWSHPVWVRGLKLLDMVRDITIISRTPCGCVD